MLSRYLTPTIWQAGTLFGVDMFTNVTDYAFHVYLGWALVPAAFAVVQTMNSMLLIVVTAFGVLQPVVARYVAEDAKDVTPGRLTPLRSQPISPRSRTIFQHYFRQGGLIGLALCLFALLLRVPLAGWLNVPVAAFSAGALMLGLVLLRPVVSGVLQGSQQFVAFGLTRTSYAVSRFLLVVLFISFLGGGAVAGVLAMPMGAVLALAVGLLLLGKDAWRKGEPLPNELLGEGWRLSLAALLAYTAYMALQNIDLIWVNRHFSASISGSFASIIVLRRVLAVLPGAILVIFYPRVVAAIARNRLPDAVLLKASAAIVGSTVLMTAVYFLWGPWLVNLMFGEEYTAAAPLLGWMGVGMIAYGLAAIWLNLFLATSPWPFVAALGATAIFQALLLSAFHETLWQVTLVFILSGWLAAVAGLALYLFWLRPRLQAAGARRSMAALS